MESCLTGFSTTACDIDVMFGDHACVPSSQTATEIVCSLDADEEPDIGISYPAKVCGC